jgi:hypothetical protein
MTIAAAPSLTGQRSYRCSGSAEVGLLTMACGLSKTPSRSSAISTCAYGFNVPISWFFRETASRCSRVTQCFSMYNRVNIPAMPGKVMPYGYSACGWVMVATKSVARQPVTSRILSPPTTRT